MLKLDITSTSANLANVAKLVKKVLTKARRDTPPLTEEELLDLAAISAEDRRHARRGWKERVAATFRLLLDAGGE